MKNKNIPFKIGHVLIQVDHLDTAILQYRQMGFQVVPGGLPGKAHNALIYLRNGSFLELFSTNHGKIINTMLKVMVKALGMFDRSYSCRLARFLPGCDGLRDYALDSIPATKYQDNIEKIRTNGLIISKPRPKSRVDHRGIRLKWTLSSPENISLPFLMSQYQPSMEIKEKDISHPNGALEIHELQITTSQWEKTYHEYSLLFGVKPEITLEKTGRSCFFPIQGTSIYLIENEKDGIERVVLSCSSQLVNTDTHAAPPSFILLKQ
ncbi:glyoxalase-like protein [Ruminiclostridium sufflavum DSM 19573]|uniref:Glyoxalase-like protein n=1 Tax=Ruminiclostridium sufflavum DSM 19573 TaxID=1121337 RepID=A0A318XS56_9FIRM|nr:VOC family protein [Ruminiclostridium sufflavum]PYG89404.1 glyoxalase-like protein [Ruminiclostridium sufflavum DSM 19573]